MRSRDHIANQEVRKILGAQEDTPNPFAGHYPQPSPMRHCFLKIPPLLNVAPMGTSLLTHKPVETSQSQTIVGDGWLSKVIYASMFRTVGVWPSLCDVLVREELVERGPTLS